MYLRNYLLGYLENKFGNDYGFTYYIYAKINDCKC